VTRGYDSVMTDGAGPRDQASLVRALLDARQAGDAELITSAAVSLPLGQRFGAHPGQVPALLYEAYAQATEAPRRCRLAAALARAWVYGGYPERSRDFAREATDLAAGTGDPRLVADALDAALLANWGPDCFAERLSLAARLEEVAAHLIEPEPRLAACLWRLTTAWECLDVVAVQRQLRALDRLAEESGSARIAYFAATRQAMHAVVTADLATADLAIARAAELGAAAAEPDLEAVTHSLAAARARRAGDSAALLREAAAFAAYGTAEGVPSVTAEAAVQWLEGGEPGRALDLLHQLAGGGLAAVARDVDFLLTTVSLVQVAAALCRQDAAAAEITAEGVRLLEPYAGRAVLNAGAVTFHGVVDEYLFRACAALGEPSAAGWRNQASASYQRLGAACWLPRLDTQLGEGAVRRPPAAAVVHLRPDGAGWLVGFDGATFALPDLKGLRYLRELARRPGADVAALELAAAGHGVGVLAESPPGEVADARALAAYRRRLRDIDAELDEARDWADEARVTRLGLEREALLREVGAAAGLAGRRRRFGSADERARVAVRKAISAALARVARQDPALARLLRDTVRTGAVCRYDPDPGRPVTWILDVGSSRVTEG
jgi:hypothetical protein